MNFHRTSILLPAFGLALFSSISLVSATDVPERSPSGQTLNVPEKHRTLGETYYVVAGAGTQLAWQTDSPLLNIGARCNRVVGYWIAPFDLEEGKPALFAGAMRIPIASFKTRYTSYDAVLQGQTGFDPANHPEILVSFTGAGPAKNVEIDGIREHCDCTLEGELHIKGKAIKFHAPVHLALMPFARPTERFSPSDLLVLRMRFSLPLEEMGLTFDSGFGTEFPSKNAEWDFSLVCTTIPPEKNLDPRIDDKLFVKFQSFMTQLRDFNNAEAAYALGRTLLKEAWGDAQLLNEIASNVLSDDDVQQKDLHFVERAAVRANALTKYQDSVYLLTLAQLCHERGNLEDAVKWAKESAKYLDQQPFYIPPAVKGTLAAYEAQAKAREESAEKKDPKEPKKEMSEE